MVRSVGNICEQLTLFLNGLKLLIQIALFRLKAGLEAIDGGPLHLFRGEVQVRMIL